MILARSPASRAAINRRISCLGLDKLLVLCYHNTAHKSKLHDAGVAKLAYA